MKVEKISFLTHSAQAIKPKESTEKNFDSKSVIVPIACVASIALAAILGPRILKKLRSSESSIIDSNNPIIDNNSSNVKSIDIDFKNKISSALKSKGIDFQPEKMDSIVGPEEFKSLVRKFKPEHYQAGLQTAQKEISPEVFYKNLIDGNFRVSLHTHSNFSDGKASVEEFLECARKYADKVAKLNKNDGLPAFTIALTDHDSVDGCAKIIEIIARDPEKYKNLKFVSGCEFSVNNNGMHHDLTGLALNPFDENLINFLENIRTARRKTIDEFLAKGKKIEGKTITREQLSNAEKEAYAKKGKGIKNSIDNGSGVVSVRHAIKYYYKLLGEKPNHDIMRELGHKDTAKIEDVVKIVSDNGGYTSLTHPLKSFWKYIGDDGLLKLKNLGVSGIEVNHQYSPSKIEEIGSKNGSAADADTIFSNLTEKYKNFAEKNEMFLSGGTDCHEKQIFSREPKITDDFLNNQILK